MKSLCKGQGFTLIELLITLAIVSVLLVLAVPFAADTIQKTREAVALANCREAVYAGYRISLDEKFQGNLGSTDFLDSPENKALILVTAGIEGQIVDTSVSINTAMVTYLQYIDEGGIIATYDSQRDPAYFIEQDVLGSAPIYNNTAFTLLGASSILETISDRDKQTQALQEIFLEENDGTYPYISSEEKEILISKGMTAETADAVNWRPMLSSNGTLFLAASTASVEVSNPLSYMIYFDDNYYYWYHYGKIKTTYVSDQSFNISILDSSLTSPPSSSGVWLCVP